MPNPIAALTPELPVRHIEHEESIWSVREVDARTVPGSRGATCLIFESFDAVRRVWIFPPDWRELDDHSLWLIGERGPRLAASLEARKQALTSAIQRSMKNLYTAQLLVGQAKEAITENVEARLKLAELLRSCRAERQAIRHAINLHASQLREGGIDVNDATMLVANAVHEVGAEMSADVRSISQMLRDANRWCAVVYRVA